MTLSKKILIIAGPNGAGKTTFATEFLPNEADCPTFINADLIAAGLNPFHPELSAVRAGRLMLEMIDDCVSRVDSFSLRSYPQRAWISPVMIPQSGKQLGYWVRTATSFNCQLLTWPWTEWANRVRRGRSPRSRKRRDSP